MRKKNAFTLIELLVTMTIMLIVLSAVYLTYISTLKGYKRESVIGAKVTEEQIGIELMRKDFSLAGIGIPISTQPLFISGSNDNYTLTLRMTHSPSSEKTLGYILMGYNNTLKRFETVKDNRNDKTANDLIVLGTDKQRYTLGRLLTGTPTYINFDCSTIDNGTLAFAFPLEDNSSEYQTITYSLIPSTLSRCFQGSSNLVRKNTYPIINCVKGVKYYFGYDNDSNGSIDGYCENSLNCDPLNSISKLYTNLKSIVAFILTHDGSKDRNFNFGSTSISYQDTETGRNITFTNLNSVPEYSLYRWKIIKISSKTVNIRGTAYEQ